LDADTPFPYTEGDFVFVPDIREKLIAGAEQFDATVICANGTTAPLTLHVKGLTETEKQIILDGCLMNYYANGNK
jgi:aconitate hydratase